MEYHLKLVEPACLRKIQLAEWRRAIECDPVQQGYAWVKFDK